MNNQFKNYIKIGMCKDRHQFPCDFSIYEGAIDDVTNINALEKIAKERGAYNRYTMPIRRRGCIVS